jgi:hypothetical protein
LPEFVDAARKELEDRLRDAREQVVRLERAVTALGGQARRGPGRPRGSTSSTRKTSAARSTTRRTGARRGRRRGSGTRAAEALELVKANPGIGIPELAQRMGIKQNYLYRVMPTLQADKKVRKKGRGWHPVGS